jgi:hypothetical protein
LTLVSETWNDFLSKEVYAKKDENPQGPTGGLGALFEGTTLDDDEVIRANPVRDSQHLISGGMVTQLAKYMYGSCEENRVKGPEITAGGEPLKLFFPGPKETGGGHGVCTCKGMMAYNFNASGTYPWRTSRQGAYSSTLYDTDPTNPASLHKCPQLNYHQAGDGKVLPSWDQLYFDARALPVEEEFFFHLELQLTDPESFGVNPQAASRRMQSTSSSSLFNLAIASSGTRALSERTLAGDYTSTGTGSFIVTSALIGSGEKSEAFSDGFGSLFFPLLMFLWFYPCFLQRCSRDKGNIVLVGAFRLCLLALIGYVVSCASNFLWYYHFTAAVSFSSWVVVTCCSLYKNPTDWDCTIEEGSRWLMVCLTGLHMMLLVLGFVLNDKEITIYGNGPTELHVTIIFVFLCPLVFIVRYCVVRYCVVNVAFAPACKDVQKDGIGFFGCFGNKDEAQDPKTEVDLDLKKNGMALFQCSVNDVMETHKEDSDIKSYGIVRRKHSRFQF